jgi:hypothetical protein
VKKSQVRSLRQCSQIAKNSQKLDFNARVQTAWATQEKSDVSRFKRTPHNPYIAPSDSFLFGWLTTQFERIECNAEDELYEVMGEILTGLSIEMIEAVFVDWMNRLQRLIHGKDDYIF